MRATQITLIEADMSRGFRFDRGVGVARYGSSQIRRAVTIPFFPIRTAGGGSHRRGPGQHRLRRELVEPGETEMLKATPTATRAARAATTGFMNLSELKRRSPAELLEYAEELRIEREHAAQARSRVRDPQAAR